MHYSVNGKIIFASEKIPGKPYTSVSQTLRLTTSVTYQHNATVNNSVLHAVTLGRRRIEVLEKEERKI